MDSSIPLCDYDIICLSIHLLVGIFSGFIVTAYLDLSSAAFRESQGGGVTCTQLCSQEWLGGGMCEPGD